MSGMIEPTNVEALFRLDDAEGIDGLAFWEIASVLTSCLLAEWVVLSFAGGSKLVGAVPVILALGLMLYSHRERGENAKDVGFRMDNFLDACRLLLLPTAAVILLLIAVATDS